MLVSGAALFGLLAALLWGGGDFGGSMAVKRTGSNAGGALLVVLIGHLLSLAVVSSLMLARGEALPHGASLLWGLAGGAVSAISLVAFYIALSTGHMGSAAAVSGLLCAAIPALVSAFLEGAPPPFKVVGFVLAGAAIWLIASTAEPQGTASRRAVVLAVLSGLGFGFYFVALKLAGEAGVLGGMSVSRTGSATTAAVLLLVLALRGDGPRNVATGFGRTLLWIAGGAALDTGGNLSFLAATRAGRLDVAAVLASIYPASTILLAALLLHERMTRRQLWGVALALPAVVLITL